MSKSIDQIRKEKNELCTELQSMVKDFLVLNPECDLDIEFTIERINLEFQSGQTKFMGHQVRVKSVLVIP